MKKGLYILPSLFTLGNIAAGVYSIINAINGRFPDAAAAIMVSLVFDILDGRIARMTKSVSKFGVELDSLADLTSFGIAPAILMYQFILNHYHNLGGVIAFCYIIAAAIRLARFNVKVDEGAPSDYFLGLPVPGAAGILAAFVLSYNMFAQDIKARAIPVIVNTMPIMSNFIWAGMLILSYLMVSNIHYTSFKKMKLGKAKPMRYLIFLTVLGMLLWLYPENMILIVFGMYILSGLFDVFARLARWSKLRRMGEKK
jgi:CDP-diacylglycerol--serine O-phosphatidyltransferase